MKKEENNSTFIFRKEWTDAISDCPMHVGRRIVYAIVCYALYGVLPEFRPGSREDIAFNFIRPQVDRTSARYDEKVERTGRRGAPIGNTNASKSYQEAELFDGGDKNNSGNKPENNSVTDGETDKNNSGTGKNNSENKPENKSENNSAPYKDKIGKDREGEESSSSDGDDDVTAAPAPAEQKPGTAKSAKWTSGEDAPKNELLLEILVLNSAKSWKKAVAKRYGITERDIGLRLPAFMAECQANGRRGHDSSEDAMAHFNNWLRIQMKLKNENKDGDRQQQKIAAADSRRRGVEAPAAGAADYHSGF